VQIGGEAVGNEEDFALIFHRYHRCGEASSAPPLGPPQGIAEIRRKGRSSTDMARRSMASRHASQ